MIGKPLYKYKDTVSFKIGEVVKTGYIYVVDAYGTFGQHEEPSYDIIVENENMLYKHVRESVVVEKLTKNIFCGGVTK